MKTTVWIVSAVLALAFLVTGLSKLVTPAADLESMAQGVPVLLLRIAGAAEVLGALGLVLPAGSRVLPWLTPLAALGLVVTMVGATVTNFAIGEPALAVQTAVMGAAAAFVAWARRGSYAVVPRATSVVPAG